MEKPWYKYYNTGVPKSLNYPEETLPEFLIKTANNHPEYIATTFNDIDISYGEMNEKANGFAHALLAMGIKKGDRVALLLPNSPTYVIATYGLLKIGAVAVNINVMMHGDELMELLNNADASTVITLDLFLQNVVNVLEETSVKNIIIHSVFELEKKIEPQKDIPDILIFNELVAAQSKAEPELACVPEDIAVLQYTSGSTGAPKATVLTHKSITANVRQINSWNPVSFTENSPVICIIPFFHVFGMTICLHLSVFEAYRMILVPMFDWSNIVEMLDLLKKYRPISFPAVSALWSSLVSYPEIAGDYLNSIEVATGGGSPLPISVIEKYKSLTGKDLVEAFGLSEVSAATHINPFHGGSIPGSVGIPLPDTDAKIMDIEKGEKECPPGEIGELVIKGPQVMKEYWKNSELTAKTLRKGWLYTGDLGRMDENGFFYLVDRKDDLIITRGFNVYPSDVEKVLLKHEHVKDAGVVGEPDRAGGQSIAAFIVCEEETGVDRKELMEYCRKHLPVFKIPKTIRFIDEIPRNKVGKQLRRVLRSKI